MISLNDKKGLVFGIANADSIAYGCAKRFREAGAELAVTFLNTKAEPHVRPLAEELGAALVLPCNVEIPGQLEAVFEEVQQRWGKLDFVVHSMAFAPLNELHGRLADSSAEGFARAMDVSCHSFIRVARLAEPLMNDGGALITMSYYGAEKVVAHYDLMGPVKAALESSVRYLAYELSPRRIRVNAISPGPIKTRAASGIDHFDELVKKAIENAPGHCLVDIMDVGDLATLLASDSGRALTGSTMYVDAGYHIMG